MKNKTFVETLKENFGDKYKKLTLDGNMVIDIVNSAEEYAKSIAIEFAVWIIENGYWYNTNVTTFDDTKLPFPVWYTPGASVGGIKTEELYNLFIEQRQK